MFGRYTACYNVKNVVPEREYIFPRMSEIAGFSDPWVRFQPITEIY